MRCKRGSPEEGVVFDTTLPQVLARLLRLTLKRERVLLAIAVLDANQKHATFEGHLVEARPETRIESS